MAITITIINLKEVDLADDQTIVHAWIKIEDGTTEYLLGVGGIPSTLSDLEIQAYLDERKDALWQQALMNGRPIGSVLFVLPERLVLRAILGLILSEINILRVKAGLASRTYAMFIDGFIAELQRLARKST